MHLVERHLATMSHIYLVITSLTSLFVDQMSFSQVFFDQNLLSLQNTLLYLEVDIVLVLKVSLTSFPQFWFQSFFGLSEGSFPSQLKNKKKNVWRQKELFGVLGTFLGFGELFSSLRELIMVSRNFSQVLGISFKALGTFLKFLGTYLGFCELFSIFGDFSWFLGTFLNF